MKVLSKKVIVWVTLLAIVLSMVGFTGCKSSSHSPKEGQTVIKMIGWGDTYETGIFQSMIEKFEKKYPEYFVSYDPVGSDNYMTVLTNAIANPREMPDVFYCADTEFIRLAYSTNIFEDLNPYIKASDSLSRDDLYTESLKAYSFNEKTKKLGDLNGALYGLPKDLGPTALVYNKEFAKAAGVKVDRTINVGYDAANKKLNDQICMTWAQYIRFANDLAEAGAKAKNSSVYAGGCYEIDYAYLSTGNSFTVWDSAENKTKLNINNNDYAMAVQFCGDLSIKYNFQNVEKQSEKTARDLFVDEQSATTWCGTWNTPSLWEANFDWDIIPTPVPSTSYDLTDVTAPAKEGLKNVTTLGSVCLSMYSESKVKDAAYKLIEFLSTDKDAQKYNYENGMALPNRVKDFDEYMNAKLSDPKDMNRPQNRIVYKQHLENSKRRKAAYTYNSGNVWETALLTNAETKYGMYHVLMKDGKVASYKPNYVIFDWSTGSMTTTPKSYDASTKDVISGKEMLEWLSKSIQEKIIDKQNGKYSFYEGY